MTVKRQRNEIKKQANIIIYNIKKYEYNNKVIINKYEYNNKVLIKKYEYDNKVIPSVALIPTKPTPWSLLTQQAVGELPYIK